MGSIRTEKSGAVCIITIDNPRKRNAISSTMADDLLAAFNTAEEDSSVRCVIVCGAGAEAFSSGHDLSEQLTGDGKLRTADNRSLMRPATMRKPVIAAINGVCYAGGLALAIHSDIRVADVAATFCTPGARLGLLPVVGQISRLPLLVPIGFATEMLLTGAPVNSEAALRAGLVTRLAPKGDALSEAMTVADSLLECPPATLANIKDALKQIWQSNPSGADVYERILRETIRSEAGSDARVSNFLAKRQPKTGAEN